MVRPKESSREGWRVLSFNPMIAIVNRKFLLLFSFSILFSCSHSICISLPRFFLRYLSFPIILFASAQSNKCCKTFFCLDYISMCLFCLHWWCCLPSKCTVKSTIILCGKIIALSFFNKLCKLLTFFSSSPSSLFAIYFAKRWDSS